MKSYLLKREGIVKFNWHVILHRMAGLLRTRVILSGVGMVVLCKNPEVGQWVVALVGMALGVSAIDAIRGNNGTGTNSGDPQ